MISYPVKKSSLFDTIKLIFHIYPCYFIPAIIISYLKGIVSYPHILPVTACFIRAGIVSYLHMSLYASAISYHIMSFHACDKPVSYVYVMFHTYRYYFIPLKTCFILTGTVFYVHVLFPAIIPRGIGSYLHMSFHACDNLFHTIRIVSCLHT